MIAPAPLVQLVDALEALGLADGVARELAARGVGSMAGELREELRAVVREEVARAGGAEGQGRLLRVSEVAEHAGVSSETVRGWLKAGKLIGSKAGREWRVRLADLDRFMVEAAVGSDEVDLDARAAEIVQLAHHRGGK